MNAKCAMFNSATFCIGSAGVNAYNYQWGHGLKGKWALHGKNVFCRGADASSCFGPDFTGTVELWLLDFNL